MTQKKGSIQVNTSDILPIIKKWLYSEHDIFLRELVSNACDAITKRSTLASSSGQEMPNGSVEVIIDKPQKTITIKDNGLGMNEKEVEKYIAQLAFSGAQEFVDKMKDQGSDDKSDIIGKFGLGFYSAFMVAEKVEVHSLSMNEGSEPTLWVCSGETDYTFEKGTKTTVGTEIVLHINEESKDFLDSWKTRSTLTRYCDFMTYQIVLTDLEANKNIEEENAKAKKEEDKKPIPFDIINETTPLWKKSPSSLKDEDYKNFYKKLFPMDADPLFWIHLNVDHPFTLQGVLYFPKLNPNKPVQENNIKLYSKQVFVSDNVKNVIPDFLGLLKGAIDSTDIPLNVSRSALQGDPNIKKISNYIVKKVSESLKKLYKNDREKYQNAWEDIGLFVKFGCTSDTKFDEVMRDKVLFKNSDDKLTTIPEYIESIPSEFTEKLKGKILYFDKETSDHALKDQLKAKSIQTVITDQYFDPHFMQHVEMKSVGDDGLKFVSVDSEIENLFESESATEDDMKIKDFFDSTLVNDNNKENFAIEIKKVKDSNTAAYFKVDEQMKRFAQMSKMMGNGGMSMPLKKTLVLNPLHGIVQNAFKLSDKNEDLAKKLCHHVKDLATISSEGLKSEDKGAFIARANDLMKELTQLAIH